MNQINSALILMSYWRTAFTWFIGELSTRKIHKIAYIMNAAKAHVLEDPSFIFNDAEEFRKTGFDVDIINLDTETDLYKKLTGYDLVYVRGGNTFDLLESVRKSGFDKVLPQLLDAGIVYASSSAGSILPGPSIEIAENDFLPDENNAGLKDKSGLGLVDFAIFPHWDEKYNKNLDELIEKLNIKYPIVRLRDNQVVLVEGGNYEIREVV